MSNKKYKNYSNISSTKPAEEITLADVEVKEEVDTEPAPTPVVKPQPKPITGTVTGCAKLNVRKEPNKEAEIVSEINEGSEVVIDKNKSTTDFYAVCTAAGVEGYCMKKFIKVKE